MIATMIFVIFSFGNFEVFPIEDSSSQMKHSLFYGITDAEINTIVPDGKLPSSINMFLVKTGKRNILVDTGLGNNDKLVNSLKERGLSPEDIDVILMTHLHGDHFGGLVKNGKAVYPKATVYVALKEKEYWTGGEKPKSATAKAALDAYGDRVKTFEFTEPGDRSPELLEGIHGIAAFGHTPAHTMFLLESSGEKLLIWGDIMHAIALQFPRPDIGIQYDTDQDNAIKTRQKVLKWVAEEKIPIAGMHIPYPGIGKVEKDEKGYKFVPWTPEKK